MLEVSLLGPLLLRRHGDPGSVHVSTSSSRAVLAYLAAGSDRAHPRSELARMLWPERSQAVASTNLRQAIARLRRAVGPDGVLTDRDTVRIGPDVAVDLTRFDALLARDAPASVARLTEATALYRGEFCSGLFLRDAAPMEDWLALTRERLDRRMLGAWDALADAHAHAGDHDAAATVARRQLELEPWRESAHRHLMTAYAATGERDRALEQYRRCEQALDAELGVAPEPATTALRDGLRSRAPSTPVDLGDTPDPRPLHGRATESALLHKWLADPGTRLVALLGLGGVGKTTLAAAAVRDTTDFDVVIWRSLLNAPPLETVLRGVLPALPADPTEQLGLLFELFRARRCLLVLDNAESVLADGADAAWRPGYEAYGQLIARAASGQHRSCVLLTSRERPPEMSRHPVSDDRVRALALSGLDADSGRNLLAAHGLAAPTAELVDHYSGNPLALTLVARTVAELFAGDLDAFVETGIPVFDGIRAVLDEQHARLSALERRQLAVLAVARVPLTAAELRGRLLHTGPSRRFLDALAALLRRNLIESVGPGFTLQNVIMEYVTDHVVDDAVTAVADGPVGDLDRFALLHPDEIEHVRRSQARILVAPVAAALLARSGPAGLASAATAHFGRLRGRPPGYAAGNLLNLLLEAGLDPSGGDLSGLAVWHADLRGRTVRDLDMRGTDLRGTAFTETFGVTRCIALSPDGAQLAIGTDDGEVRIWDRPGGELAGVLSVPGARVTSVVFGDDGTLVAAASDGVIRIWDVPTLTLRRELPPLTGSVQSVALSPDGTLIAGCGFGFGVRLWDAGTGAPGPRLQGDPVRTWSVAFAPDGATLAAGNADGSLHLWDVATGHSRATFHDHTELVLTLAFSPDGRLLASAGSDRDIRVRDARTGAPVAHLTGHTNLVWSVAFAPDGATLASAAGDATIRFWDTATWTVRRTLDTGASTPAIGYSPDGTTVVGALFDQTLHSWDAHTGETLHVRHGHTAAVTSLAAGPDGTIVAGGMDRRVRVWDVPARRLRADLAGHVSGVFATAWAGAARPASGSADGTVRLWDARSGRATVLRGHTDEITSVAVDPAGTLLASGSEDCTVRLWDARDGSPRGVLAGHEHWAVAVRFDVDGALWSGGRDGTVLRWDPATGTRTRALHVDVGHLMTLSVHPSGTSFAVAGDGGWVGLVDASTGTAAARLDGHDGQVLSVTHAPDGRILASAGADGTVRTWDAATGAALLVIPAHGGWAWAVAFTADGLLASGGADGAVRLWDAATGADRGTLVADGPYARTAIGGATGLSPARAAALLALGAVDGPPAGAARPRSPACDDRSRDRKG